MGHVAQFRHTALSTDLFSGDFGVSTLPRVGTIQSYAQNRALPRCVMSADGLRRWQVATNRKRIFGLNVPNRVIFERSTYQPRCPICDRTVRLETAKTDELGMAIHDNCYWLKLK